MADISKNLSTDTKWLLGLWVVFLLLVAFGVHGSSTGASAPYWAPERPYNGYLFGIPKMFKQGMTADQVDREQELVMAKARWIRGDESIVFTPYALSQLSHDPPFPVVNTNVGDGQNMLVWAWHFPVLHISALARPATWGYFFLGPQRGLAWYWWFQVFSCFTALYLLLSIVLKGRKGLAAFGAFWFCGSAYVVCFSLWPAYITFHPALACVSAYYLLTSEKRAVQVVSAILLGLSIAGFFMMVYPAWQVPLGYLFLFVFAGLFIRDKLYRGLKPLSRYRLLCIIGSLLLGSGLIASFLITCLPALKIMSETVYPGRRVSLGGDYTFALLFKGMYNLLSIYQKPPPLLANESESASFYHLFPAVFLGICLSRRLIFRLGVFGWLLVLYLVAIVFFMLVGLPESVARLTMVGYAPPQRIDLALGLSSIILCTYAHSLRSTEGDNATGWWDKIMPLIGGGIVGVFFILHGLMTIKATGAFLSVQVVFLASLLAGFASYCLLSGRKVAFCGLVGVIIVATSALFNPLSTNLNHLYYSELARQIVKIENQSGEHPLWLCYGNVQPDILIATLGSRALAGTQWPPQLSLWQKFDPSGQYRARYNRYAQVYLLYEGESKPVSFTDAGLALEVHISPSNPILKEMGARYVLAFDDHQQKLLSANLIPIYKSPTGRFSIFEIPREPQNGQSASVTP